MFDVNHYGVTIGVFRFISLSMPTDRLRLLRQSSTGYETIIIQQVPSLERRGFLYFDGKSVKISDFMLLHSKIIVKILAFWLKIHYFCIIW